MCVLFSHSRSSCFQNWSDFLLVLLRVDLRECTVQIWSRSILDNRWGEDAALIETRQRARSLAECSPRADPGLRGECEADPSSDKHVREFLCDETRRTDVSVCVCGTPTCCHRGKSVTAGNCCHAAERIHRTLNSF